MKKLAWLAGFLALGTALSGCTLYIEVDENDDGGGSDPGWPEPYPPYPPYPPPPPPPPGDCQPVPVDPCADSYELGYYEGYTCELGYPFIQTEQISCWEALDNCILNSSYNPEFSYSCFWNGREIYRYEVFEGACAQFGPGQGKCEPPPPPPSLPPPPDVPGREPPALGADAACADTRSESTWCLTVAGGNTVQALGLDTQTSCNLLENTAINTLISPSLAVLGTDLYACGGPNMELIKVSLIDGSSELIAEVPCMGVTNWEGGLLVQPLNGYSSQLDWYQTFEQAKAREPSLTMQVPELWASRHVAIGNTLYAAWHSTSTVDAFSLPDGQKLGTLPLEGYDDWILGMDLLPGGLFYMLDWYGDVRTFDGYSGTFYGQFTPQGPSVGVRDGLICFSNY